MIDGDEVLLRELTHLGRRVHWSLGDLLDLDHATRRAFIAELERTDER